MMRRGPSQGAHAGLVLVHGRGSSAADILSLLDLVDLPQVAAIAPEAAGNSWWPTSFLAPAAQVEPFVTAGLAKVAEAVAALESQGIPRGAIWLAGFSQGACLAAEAYARTGQGLAGLFALSGGLVGTGDTGGEVSDALYGFRPKHFDYTGPLEGKVWLSVHEQDPHIPLARVRETANVLTGLGARVETRIHPGAGHGLMQDDLMALQSRLGR